MPSKRMLYIALPVVIVAVGFVAMLVLLGMREEPPRRATQPRPRIVEARIVELTDVPSTIIVYGRVSSAQPVELISEVTGMIEPGDIPYQPAQSFARGDILLKIDDRPTRLAINSKKSDLLTALATVLPEIKVDFPGEYNAWQTYFDAISFNDPLPELPKVNDRKIKLFLSRFNVYGLYFDIRDLEIKLDKHYFRAPFAGSIVSTIVRVGSTARSGNSLGEIISLEDLEVEVPVAADDIAWIDFSRPVVFTSAEMPGEWTGRIIRVGKSIDERTQTIPVFISLDISETGPLFQGAFLQAYIPGKEVPDAIAIPRQALYSDQYVYLIHSGTLEFREVSVIRKENEEVIVDGGIATGDTLVVEVLQGVAPGMPAQALFIEPDRETRP